MKYSRTRILRAAAITAAATLALSGCGVGSTENQELSDEPVTLRFTWWGGDARHELTQEVIDAFEEENRNITVDGEFGDWSGYWDKLATTVAADDAPDVVQMDQLYLASYADRGALLDLGTMSEFLDTSDIEQSALEAGNVGDTLYAIPIGINAGNVMVNQDIFDKLGVSLPNTDTWTWDDLAAIAQEIADKSGGTNYGFAPPGGDHMAVAAWARQSGEDLFDQEGNVSIRPETLASYWQYALGLVESGAAPPATQIVETSTAGIEQSLLATGAVAMAFVTSSQLPAYTAASGGANMTLNKVPSTGGGEENFQYFKPSMYWAVSSGTEHPAEAALFVDFLANSETAGELLLTERGIPANTSVLESIRDELPPMDIAAVDYLDSIEEQIGDIPPLTPNGASALDATLSRYYQDVLFGQITPEEAAAAFITELQTAIDSA